MRRILFISAFLTLGLISSTIYSQNPQKTVYVFHLHEEIFKPAWRLVDKAVSEAERLKADYIIMKINTYGGEVTVADSIRTRLLNAKPITIALIDNNAASAGALISIACDSIYMVKGASIGAATVVDQSGQPMPDKYQSYMRSIMRATAEVNQRDPLIAEAMVDPRTIVPGVNDSGKVLTFTTSEAIKNHYCEGETADVEALLKKAGILNARIIEHKVTGTDKFIAFLLSPMVNSLLLLLIIGGIYFELKTPGIGFPLAAALVGAVLYFAPLYLEGLAAHWEILIFIAGLILLGAEIFIIPGFGVAGITGILFIITGLTLSLVNNINLNFEGVGMPVMSRTFFRVTITLVVGLVLLFAFGGSLMKSPLFQRIVLQTDQKKEAGYSIRQEKLGHLTGLRGTVFTDLRPAGKIIIDTDVYDAITQGEMLRKGEEVIVLREEGYSLIVKKA